MSKAERFVTYGLLLLLGSGVLYLAGTVRDLKAALPAAAAPVVSTAQVQWVAPGTYPSNIVGVGYGQFYWVNDPVQRTLTLHGVKGRLEQGMLKIDQDRIGTLNY